MFSRPLFLPLFLILALAQAGAATISTVAGTGIKGDAPDGTLATEAQINDPFGVIRGPDGALWFCEYGGQRVRKITADGKLKNVAGNGKTGFSGDGGPALEASLNKPHEIRFDKAGNLYIVDMVNHAVRRVDAKTQVITTFAGIGGSPGYSGDGGPADKAQFKQPHSIQFDPSGEYLYICDIGNNVIRKVDMKSGTISTFAGTGAPGATPDGAPITGTPLRGPRSIDFDAQGHLWLVTREGNQVFKFDLKAGKIAHMAGNGKKGFTGNGGPAKDAALSGPKGVAIAPNGDVYLADTESHSVRMIDAKTGNLELVAGTGEKGDGPDGDPLGCKMARLHGVFVDKDGAVFIGDSETHRVRVLRP